MTEKRIDRSEMEFVKSFSTAGRIGRLKYGVSLIIAIVGFLLGLFFSIIDYKKLEFGVIGISMGFAISQGSKRCHDFGKSGWYQFIPLFFIYMLLKKGDAGMNRYGGSPKMKYNTPPADTSSSSDGSPLHLNKE